MLTAAWDESAAKQDRHYAKAPSGQINVLDRTHVAVGPYFVGPCFREYCIVATRFSF